MADRTWQVRRVDGADALVAIEILREASAWTSGFGPAIWPPESFTVEEHRVLGAAGEQVGGFEGSLMVACMRLHARDPIYWADDPPGEALYIHKLAVRRAASGRGWTARMIDWAVDECRARHARALRLDTLANGKLPSLYERCGFAFVDRTAQDVGGFPIVRMQRLIAPD